MPCMTNPDQGHAMAESLSAKTRLRYEMSRFAHRLCQELSARGRNSRMEHAAGVFASRNGVRIRLSIDLNVRRHPTTPDLSEYCVHVRARRVFDAATTNLALGMPLLASTLKGDKSDDLVAEQLLEQFSDLPCDAFVDAFLAATA